MLQSRLGVKQLNAGGGRTWFIMDMPQRPPKLEFVKRQWRGHGPKDTKRWFPNFRRTVSSNLFNPKTDNWVDFVHGDEGMLAMGGAMRRFGDALPYLATAYLMTDNETYLIER